MSPTPRRPPKLRPVKEWQRAEAGRYRSSDERFTLESDGAGRWFVVDEHEQDELGLARTSGPFATLEAAKAAAAAARDRPATPSPLAARIADAAGRPRQAPGSPGAPPGTTPPDVPPVARPTQAAVPVPPRTWLDELQEQDADLARRATRLIRALEREGVPDADALVRRDILGDRPAVATRLLARDVLAAIAALSDPTAAAVAEAVAGVLAASPTRTGLPGWDLVERNAAGERGRPIRMTLADLTAAAGDRVPDRGLES